MATVKEIKTPVDVEIRLSNKEAVALNTLLGSGVTIRSVDELGLSDLASQLVEIVKTDHSVIFKSYASLA